VFAKKTNAPIFYHVGEALSSCCCGYAVQSLKGASSQKY